jgi:phosphatidylglycerophosphate synthase
MVQKRPVADGIPWIGIRMVIIAGLLLIITMIEDDAHTFARFLIVVLWLLTSFAAMVKESMTYGLGDRVTLFGTLLILAISVAAALFDPDHFSFLNVFSVGWAVITLWQVIKNVAKRQRQVEVFDPTVP